MRRSRSRSWGGDLPRPTPGSTTTPQPYRPPASPVLRVAAFGVPHPELGRVAWQVNGERSRPHSIMVNKKGRRFADEAANYNALGAAFHVLDVTEFDYVNHPAWLVFDVPMRGSLILFFTLCLLGAMSFCGIGLLIASRVRTTSENALPPAR